MMPLASMNITQDCNRPTGCTRGSKDGDAQALKSARKRAGQIGNAPRTYHRSSRPQMMVKIIRQLGSLKQQRLSTLPTANAIDTEPSGNTMNATTAHLRSGTPRVANGFIDEKMMMITTERSHGCRKAGETLFPT